MVDPIFFSLEILTLAFDYWILPYCLGSGLLYQSKTVKMNFRRTGKGSYRVAVLLGNMSCLAQTRIQFCCESHKDFPVSFPSHDKLLSNKGEKDFKTIFLNIFGIWFFVWNHIMSKEIWERNGNPEIKFSVSNIFTMIYREVWY